MRMPLRWLVVCGALLGALGTLSDLGSAGGKESPWKPFLPAKDYRTLVERAAANIEESLTGKVEEEGIKRAQFNAVMIAAYTLSTKDGGTPQELATVREAALKIAHMVTEKKKLEDAKKLAKALLTLKADPNAKLEPPDVGKYVEDRADIMEHYKVKSKGGDGIHTDLQSNIRLKGALNGIEEKLRDLATKPKTQLVVDKESNELGLLAYRAAVHAGLIHYYAPAKKIGDRDPNEWREISIQMREAGIQLADAARKKDPEAVFKAGSRLHSSCSQCHSRFRMGS